MDSFSCIKKDCKNRKKLECLACIWNDKIDKRSKFWNNYKKKEV